jgi:hypothetical protein
VNGRCLVQDDRLARRRDHLERANLRLDIPPLIGGRQEVVERRAVGFCSVGFVDLPRQNRFDRVRRVVLARTLRHAAA